MTDNNPPTGFLLINKPAGLTSHDVISRLRRLTKIKKIGHAGTLDPFATGLLIVAVGREATREISQFVKQDKEYLAEFKLGTETDSYDLTGQIVRQYAGEPLPVEQVAQAVDFLAQQTQQLPPMYSAKKVGGKKLYELARQNIEIERAPQAIIIHELAVLNYVWPLLAVRIGCSSGTYIRSLAFDLGRWLGCGAHVTKLTRTKIGPYDLEQAVDLSQITTENWQTFLFTPDSD